MSTKIVFLIADGMGDWPLEELGGRTPMAAARCPHMDSLAASGLVGLCRTVPKTMPPGSDVANMALLGFDPTRHHSGRGPIEAAAQGLELSGDDLVWRLNLLSLTGLKPDGIMLDYSAGHIPTDKSAPIIRELAAALCPEGGVFEMVPGVQYRHLLIQRGGASAPEASLHIRPPHDITNQPITQDFEAYATSPRLMDLLSRAEDWLAASNHGTKASGLWPWGQGRALKLPDFKAAFGLTGAVISAVDLIKGLGRAAGMEVLEVEGATGLLDTNYEGKVQAALDYLLHGDFVFLHVEAPDECGHAGATQDKVEAIERFDARVVGPMVSAMQGQDVAFLVACDHFTPVVRRTHTPDPVPFLLSGPALSRVGLGAPGPAAFTEQACAEADLLIEPGHGLLAWVLARLGRPGGSGDAPR